ncbi:hypothetical protein YC2023_071318 [Brassica napus]
MLNNPDRETEEERNQRIKGKQIAHESPENEPRHNGSHERHEKRSGGFSPIEEEEINRIAEEYPHIDIDMDEEMMNDDDLLGDEMEDEITEDPEPNIVIAVPEGKSQNEEKRSQEELRTMSEKIKSSKRSGEETVSKRRSRNEVADRPGGRLP